MDKVQKVGEKNGFICQVAIFFTPAVTVIKMSKIALFNYFLPLFWKML